MPDAAALATKLTTRPTPDIARSVMTFMLERWECDRMRLRELRDQLDAEMDRVPMGPFNADYAPLQRAWHQVDCMLGGIDNAICDAPKVSP